MAHKLIVNSKLMAMKKPSTDFGFKHISQGNWDSTLAMLEDYLSHLGILKQTKIAALIMFFERSFAGKYRHNRAAHYQSVTPIGGVEKGRSLCEKLERCKNKDTFNKKFSFVGHTEHISDDHLKGVFGYKGKIYLRLIDRQNNNKSWFFRNDLAVQQLLLDSRIFSSLKSDKTMSATVGSESYFGVQNHECLTNKTMSAADTKPCVLSIENHECLDSYHIVHKNTQEIDKTTTLVQPSAEQKKVNEIVDSTFIEGVLSSTLLTLVVPILPITTEDTMINHFLKPATKISKSSAKRNSTITADNVMSNIPLIKTVKSFDSYITIGTPKETVSAGLYDLYSDCILVYCKMSANKKPSGKDLTSIYTLYTNFKESYPAKEIVPFFEAIMKNWSNVQSFIKDNGSLEGKGAYPNIGWINFSLPYLIKWYSSYKSDLAMVASFVSKAGTSIELPNETLQTPISSVKGTYVDKFEKNSSGYTYIGGFKYDSVGGLAPTFEDRMVEAMLNGKKAEITQLEQVLLKNAVNFESSMVRVNSLVSSQKA